MIRSVRTAALVAAAILTAPLAAATVTASDPASVAAVLSDAGYKAELVKGTDGDPFIRSASSGQAFLIFFLGCTNGRGCTTVQFYAGWKKGGTVSVATVNEWNRTHRFARGYLDSSNDPVIETDVDLDEGGMSAALFADNLAVWVQSMAAFDKAVNN